MLGAFIVVVDNGQQWSSHRRFIAAACPTEADADALKATLKAWLATRPMDEYGDVIDPFFTVEGLKPWLASHPWPLGGDVPEEAWSSQAVVAYCPVPLWAQGV